MADELYGGLSQWFYTYADSAVDGDRESVTGYGQMCRLGIYPEKREKLGRDGFGDYGKRNVSCLLIPAYDDRKKQGIQ